MKISIITVCFNAANTLADCINSVVGQDFCNKEHIIIDGASTDNTMQIVSSFSDHIGIIRSEKDQGLYDAMNKGISLATGDVIGILNADDIYADSQVLSRVAKELEETKKKACYGDLVYVDAATAQKVTRRWKSGEYKRDSFLWGWMPPHPTLFLDKEVYRKFGKFRMDMGSAADYEFMLRIFFKYGIEPAYIPEVLVKMRAGGVSNLTLKNRLKANAMDRRAWKVNDLKPYPFTTYLKPIRKISQFC